MRYLIEGKSNKEIAILLQISPKTVETHKINSFRKLGAVNGPHAAAIYVTQLIRGEK
jgi:DNA-binding CsgD family transcriptional regulator